MGFDVYHIRGYRFLRVSMIFIDFRGIPKIVSIRISIRIYFDNYVLQSLTKILRPIADLQQKLTFQAIWKVLIFSLERQSAHNFRIPERKSQTTNFSISFRGPYLWNNYLSENIKTLTSLPAFKKATKQTLLNTNNELNFFR